MTLTNLKENNLKKYPKLFGSLGYFSYLCISQSLILKPMEKDTYTTDIIFRVDTTKEFKGTVFAIFPHDVCTHSGLVTTYQHVGQHSGGDYQRCIETSRLAKPSEYKELKKEMESLGYNIVVRKRRNYDKYLTDLKRVRGW
jgi:hypothetical protein